MADPAKRRWRLRSLRLGEVSLVDRPANPGAVALLFKSENVVSPDSDQSYLSDNPAGGEDEMTVQELTAKVAELEKKLKDAEADTAKVADLQAQLDKAKTDAEAAVRAAEDKAAALQKQVDEAKLTDDKSRIADLQKRLDESEAKLKKLEDAPKDEVIKVGDTEIRKSAVGEDTFRAFKAQQAALDKAADEREVAEFTKVAETTYKNIPGDPVAKARALRAVSRLAEDDRKVVEAALKAGNEAIARQLTERGHTGGLDEGSAEGLLEAKVKAAMAADDKLSREEAFDKVLEANGDLYDRYLAEKRQAA